MTTPYAKTVQTAGLVCSCCDHERDETPEEAEYDRALEHLIKAAKLLNRSQRDVELDLYAWFREVRIKDAAALDKNVVRLWWIQPERRVS